MSKYNKVRVIALIIFIIVVIISTKVVEYLSTNISNLSTVEKVDNFKIEDYSKNTVLYSVAQLEMYNNLAKEVYIHGWSFIETDFDADNREVYIILNNPENNDTYKKNILKIISLLIKT